MKNSIWGVAPDDGSGLPEDGGIFSDDEHDSGQVRFCKVDETDSLPGDDVHNDGSITDKSTVTGQNTVSEQSIIPEKNAVTGKEISAARLAQETITKDTRPEKKARATTGANHKKTVVKNDNKENRLMSEYDNLIAKAVSSIPECLAGGVVDLGSGMLVGVKTVDSHPQEVLDMLAAATHDLFQGPNVVNIEDTFKRSRGLEIDDFHYFKEIIVNSENLIHVFMRGKQQPQYVITFVCRLSANLGMVLTKARAQVPILEAAL